MLFLCVYTNMRANKLWLCVLLFVELFITCIAQQIYLDELNKIIKEENAQDQIKVFLWPVYYLIN